MNPHACDYWFFSVSHLLLSVHHLSYSGHSMDTLEQGCGAGGMLREGEMGRAWALNLPPVKCQLQLPPASGNRAQSPRPVGMV